MTESEAEGRSGVPERRARARRIEAQSAAMARAMASIGNDEPAGSGVPGGHERTALSLSDLQLEHALRQPLLQPPDDFAERVLAALPARPAPRRSGPTLGARMRAVIVALVGVWGALQTAAYVLGPWTAALLSTH